MRIHLTLEPSLLAKSAPAGPSSSPMAQLGGEIVLIELQGELNWEGEKAGGVVGVLGLDRPDKPTLHLGPHHLLHGRFANLPKPLAIIRRGVTAATDESGAVQGDLDEEAEEEEDELDDVDGRRGGAGSGVKSNITPNRPIRPSTTSSSAGKKRKATQNAHSEDEDDPPLFPEAAQDPSTPVRPANRARRNSQDDQKTPASSSPFLPAPSMRDFSSELDFSSPPPSSPGASEDVPSEVEEMDETEQEAKRATREAKRRRKEKLERKKAERRAQRPERTRMYEVVGLVRRKVVFALRPEPIVTATILPD